MTMKMAVGFLKTPVALAHGEFKREQRVVLLPWGRTDLRDGTKLLVDETGTQAVIDDFNSHGVNIPFDKNHSTILKAPYGDDAPAFGWGKKIVAEKGKALSCEVEWTEEGFQEIESGRYRYLSAVVGYEEDTGRVRMVHSVALTTNPATPQMPALAASQICQLIKETRHMDGLLKKLLQEGEGTVATAEQKVGELKKVLEAKGVALGDGADFVAILNAAIAHLEGDAKTEEGEGATEEAAVAASVRQELGLAKNADKAVVLKALAGMKGHIGYVPAAEHQKVLTRVDALEDTERERQAGDLIEACLSEGKLIETDEGQMKWARGFAQKNPDDFKALMTGAPVIVPQGRTAAPGAPGKPGVSGASGKEDELITKALTEHNGNYKNAMVALQTSLMDVQRDRGLNNRAAGAECAKLYPKIFGAAA